MEQLKRDIYAYFRPMASSDATAQLVTSALVDIITNHLSEYYSMVDTLINTLGELQEQNLAMSNRLQAAETGLIESVRLMYDAIIDANTRDKLEKGLDALEQFQREL